MNSQSITSGCQEAKTQDRIRHAFRR